MTFYIPPPLITKNLTAIVDEGTRLVCYKYGTEITIEDIVAVYARIKADMEAGFKEDRFRGGIMDFREVKKFPLGNTLTVNQESTKVQNVVDLSVVPVALIVSNVQQEVKIRMTMMGSGAHRKCVVYSEQDALAFINEWNIQHDRHYDISPDLLLTYPQIDHLPEKI